MNLKDRVIKLKSSGLDDDKKISRVLYQYRIKFKMTHEELIKEPIPTFFANLHWMTDEAKKKNKTMRGKK